ncbi:hypothetical protein Tco_1225296, partial [Tanacetum coccineum]
MKNICITIHHEGTFAYDPLSYEYSDVDVVENVNLGNCNYGRLMKIVRERCLFPVHSLYFYAPKVDIGKHLKPLRNDYELANFIKLAYDNGCKVELYVEHHGFDVMAEGVIEEVVDEEVDDEIEMEDISEYVGLDHVVDGKFISDKDFGAKVDTKSSSSRNVEVEDSSVDDRFKVKEGFSYPVHNLNLSWNEMAPLLGMKFEHSDQLKDCLINYGVTNGYQLWYRRNDYMNISVMCRKNVKEGSTSNAKSPKSPKTPKSKKSTSKKSQSPKTPKSKKSTSKKSQSPKTPKSPNATPNVDVAHKGCSFRLWAGWMQNVREKFLINDYRDEILSTNPGSSVQLDVDTMNDGKLSSQ